MDRRLDAEIDTFSRVKEGPQTTVSGGGNTRPLTRKLDRYLKSLPVIAFGITLQASWESTINGVVNGLTNGGPSSLVWGFLVAGPGTAMIVLSLAEMASITPSVGAQYRWAAIYSPSYLDRRFLSFLQGWLTVFGWIASTAVTPFGIGSQICGLVKLNYLHTYEEKGWHTTLVAYATILLPLLANIYARKLLKPIELVGVVLHFALFVVFVVVLIALGGRNSAEYVFTANSAGVSGWKNNGTQWCIGLLSVVFPLTTFDGVLHLSDEVHNPAIRIPRSMIYSWTISAVSAFGFMIILLFFMGDPKLVLETPTGWPIIQIIFQALRTVRGTNALMSVFLLTSIVSYFNLVASVTRLTWAFARDDGLPFSDYFKRVHPTLRMPTRALALTTIVTLLLLLIPVGSTTAFNALLSLAVLSLYVSYVLPCIFVFLQRISGEQVVTSAWSLGRWGVWVNGAASIYGIFICVWLCFPSELPVTAANLNWAGPITGFVFVFSLLDWAFRGRYKWAVPTEKSENIEDYVNEERAD